MEDVKKQKIKEFWRAKTVLTFAVGIMSIVAFGFIMSDRINTWVPWLFIASAVAVLFFDLRKGLCPYCGKLIKTVKLGKADRFRFCPHCGESLWTED
ncbi:MAG: hypothetical protein HGA80_04755 [Candidatus Omnitrophica bacterium]|nr:hypothetical protein [Candidatus Omnitrophota bacterium]